MADDLQFLAQVQLGTAAAPVFGPVAGGSTVIVRHMRIVNTNATTDRTVTLWHTGTTAADMILPPVTIDGGGWGEFEGTIIMEAGQTLYGRCTELAAEVTVTLYGMEVT